MYDDRWAEALQYKYCRTPHYLTGDILTDERFTKQDMSYGPRLFFDGCSVDRFGTRFPDLFFVGIRYDPETYEITSFDCSCTWEEGSRYYRRYSPERPVNKYDRKIFFEHFEQFVTKDPDQAKLSWNRP